MLHRLCTFALLPPTAPPPLTQPVPPAESPPNNTALHRKPASSRKARVSTAQWPVLVWSGMTEVALEYTPQRAALLWTGGKDSCLALYEAKLLGYRIESLVTFVPRKGRFRAHPVDLMRLQAQALGLPHYTMEVREPFLPAYREAIAEMTEKYAIRTLVTGDTREVDGHPNWIRECAGSNPMVLTPLWGRDATELLNCFISRGFRAIFSCVRTRWLAPEWVGRRLDTEAAAELTAQARRLGFDACGERGEYHTLVLDGPLFEKRIRIDACFTRMQEDFAYLQVREASLETTEDDKYPNARGHAYFRPGGRRALGSPRVRPISGT